MTVAVVTGAAQGIGLGIAELLLERGWQVSLWDADSDRLAAAVDRLCGAVDPARQAVDGRCVDVTDTSAVDAATNAVLTRFGSMDALITAAMLLRRGPLTEQDDQAWQDTLEVGLNGVFKCCRAIGSVMQAQRHGAIVNIASLAAWHAQTYLGSYSATKAGVVALTRQLAVEWGPFGIRCNSVSPGLIRTPPTEHLYRDTEAADARRGIVPLRRFGDAGDVARVVAFLVSQEAGYVSGADVTVDGGLGQTLIDQIIGGDRALRSVSDSP